MKLVLLSFVVFTLFSCENKSKSNVAYENLNLTLNNKTETNSDLVGEWGIHVMGDAYCYSCPKAIFKANGFGEVIHPSNVTELIKWGLDKDKLKITNISTNKDSGLFNNGEYQMKFEKKGESTELQLTEIGTSYSFHLRR